MLYLFYNKSRIFVSQVLIIYVAICRIMLYLILPYHSCDAYQNFYIILILIIKNYCILYLIYNPKLQILLYSLYTKKNNLHSMFNQMTSRRIYKSELVGCFNLAFNTSYGNGYKFLNKELLN